MNNVLKFESFSKSLNDITFTDYYYRLMLIAKSVFQWNNLPNGINEKWIEKYLFSYGKCVFFHDKEKGFMVTKVTESGTINFYDEPTKLTPFGTNFIGTPKTNGVDCVLIGNNDEYIPTQKTVELYAWRLADISRTIDVNIAAQKTPVVVCCSEKQKNSLKRAMKKVHDNEMVIFADNNLDIDGVKVLNTASPTVFPQLQTQKHAIWNECMTFLGINNANMEKRERLVDDEVQANNDQIEMCAKVMLKAREDACNKINEMFGLNISVEIRKDLDFNIEEENLEVM